MVELFKVLAYVHPSAQCHNIPAACVQTCTDVPESRVCIAVYLDCVV